MMDKKINVLRKIGEKMATKSIDPRCTPLWSYQPKPPAKIFAKMQDEK